MRKLKETDHDYQGCLCGNFYSNDVNGNFNSWNGFKSAHYAFAKDDNLFEKYDDRYHFVFRYDIHKEVDDTYTLELCMMLQRKGIYSHIYVSNISEEELNSEVKIWLDGRLKYLKSLWEEVS